jgi:hypothetical protein
MPQREKYKRVGPRSTYLCDPIVLQLAWKKSHRYIRRHNWYADGLELDASATDIDRRSRDWARELATENYNPTPMRLVPAPKNARWGFHSGLPGGWAPVEAREVQSGQTPPTPAPIHLRPLAHVGIREQSIASAAMLCLADCVESLQGDPTTKFEDALRNDVFSYGNRLFCRWDANARLATFSWGSSDSYSQYFRDYQLFLRRPRHTAFRVESAHAGKDQAIYIVKLDLESFYDRIDVARLVKLLQRHYLAFRRQTHESVADDQKFWRLTQRALSFKWSGEDSGLAELLKGAVLPTGLPQGLMASGFFSNAYLIGFDTLAGRACKKRTSICAGGHEVILHDYCRYVDDLRFVVTTSALASEVELTTAICTWTQKLLDKALQVRSASDKGRLVLNHDKTELELLSKIAGATNISARMQQLQHTLSGPFDVATLEQAESALNGMLSTAEGSVASGRPLPSGELPSLASVAKPTLDVRDDTLTRFAANRLCRTLRQRRLLSDLTETVDGHTREAHLRHDYEFTSRRLIAAWAENPSLVQVLRYALDLFPEATLAEEVCEALAVKVLGPGTTDAQRAVAWYVLAELFRAGATETGFRNSEDDSFRPTSLADFRRALARRAVWVTELPEKVGEAAPWYVQQQAALLLAALEKPTTKLSLLPELQHYRNLHDYLLGGLTESVRNIDALLSVAYVGYEISGDTEKFIAWLKVVERRSGAPALARLLERVFLVDARLFEAIARAEHRFIDVALELTSPELRIYALVSRAEEEEALPNGAWIPLVVAIRHSTRPFSHENALIQLAIALVGLPKVTWSRNRVRSAFDLEIFCAEWATLQDPKAGQVQLRVVQRPVKTRLYERPQWLDAKDSWKYPIGRVLRAAAMGEVDFTAMPSDRERRKGWYRGIASTSLKRSIGLADVGSHFGMTTSAITPRYAALVTELLRWPGTHDDKSAIPAVSANSLGGLARFLARRHLEQSALFGRGSNTPIYRFPVAWDEPAKRELRIAVLQGLLPRTKDFIDLGLVGLNAPPFRARHRNHLAALLHLASRVIGVRNSSHGRPHKPSVDVVVLPEYSVHVDDRDLLRVFSDATGAMIHFGLLGAVSPVTGAPTNMSRWLIPNRRATRRGWIEIDQGKLHLTPDEVDAGVTAWCPYRLSIELAFSSEDKFRIAGAICFDATDLSIASDFKNESHMFVVTAMNKDVKTFDSLIATLRYHMYQHIVLANTGEFGGSTAQAPYDAEHRRVLSHAHGLEQIAVATFEVSMDDFGPNLKAAAPPQVVSIKRRVGKSPPAGLSRN